MKRGIISLISIGFLFSVLNFIMAFYFPNAYLIFYASTLIFLLILILYILIKRGRINKLITSIVLFGLYVLLNGILFKVMNWSTTFLYPDDIKQHSILKAKHEPYNWKEASVAHFISDTSSVNKIIEEHSKYWFSRSLLIIKNDTLILEKYFNGTNKDDAFNIMSVTKSFTSALIGIAINKGYIRNTQENLSEIFPEYFKAHKNSEKSAITIKQLLAMQAGYSFGFSGQEGYDWLKTILNHPLNYEPGKQFCYSEASSHILSEILLKSTKMKTEDFAEQFLFKPLGIHSTFWIKSPRGVNAGNWGLFITPRDMARFGNLYLHNGTIDNKQILPKAWIDFCFQNSSMNLERCDEIPFDNYGFHWWIKEISNTKTFSAVGKGGQLIMLVPDKSLIIVTTNSGNETDADLNTKQTLNTIEKLISLL